MQSINPTRLAGRSPRAYLCVYRQVIPSQPKLLAAARLSAAKHRDMAQLLPLYANGCAYDWGDDPSFFSATFNQGSAAHAGWGICRPNVRKRLDHGDLVVFFCARRSAMAEDTEYLFAGFGSIGERIDDRRQIWSTPRLAPYRNHLNILVRYNAAGVMEQYERFEPGHPKDWPKRAESPYLIFDASLSQFNALDPLLVARAAPGEKHETWLLDRRPKVRRLHRFLFDELGMTRPLRTSAAGFSHPAVNLGRLMQRTGITADQVRACLSAFVESK